MLQSKRSVRCAHELVWVWHTRNAWVRVFPVDAVGVVIAGKACAWRTLVEKSMGQLIGRAV